MSENRPKEFDRLLTAYIPALRKMAGRNARLAERDDLVQDTVAYALTKWELFRNPEGDYKNFASWLQWQMRAVLQDRADKACRQKRTHKDVPFDAHGIAAQLSAPARQHDITYANQIVRRLSKTREGRMLVLLGRGDMLKDVGAKRGLSVERVRQLTEKARTRLVKSTKVAA